MSAMSQKRFPKKALSVCLLLLVVILTLGISIYQTRQETIAQNSAYLEYASVQVAQHIDDFLLKARTNLETTAYLYENTLEEPKVPVEDLQFLAKGNAAFDYVEFADLDGHALLSNGSTGDVSDREYYRQGLAGHSGIEALFDSRFTTEDLMIAFYAPVHYEGQVIGVLAGMYQGAKIQELLTTTFQGAPTRNFLCLDDGTVFLSSESIKANGQNIIDTLGQLMVQEQAARKDTLEGVQAALTDKTSDYEFTYPGLSGTGLGYMTVLPETGWHLIQTFPSSISASMSNSENYRDFLLEGLLVFFFGVYIAYLLSDYRKALNKRKEELNYWEQLFNLLTANSSDIYVLFSPDTLRAEYISPNLNQALGLNPEDVKKDVRSIFQTAVDGKDSLITAHLGQSSSGAPWKTNRQLRHNNTGDLRWYQEALYRMTSQEANNFVLVLSDRTLEHRANVNLAQALEIANQTSQNKSFFLSSVSHDIRTPMNAIMGFAALLEKNAGSPERVRQYTGKIISSGQHLISLINDVLDMNKIESGKISLNISQFNMAELLDDLNSIIAPQAAAKEQSFQIQTHGKIPEYLFGDRLRLEQILLNLLSNAVKYTQEGGAMELTVQPSEQQPASGQTRLRFTVKDNGLGMSQEFLSSIYDPFARECSEATKNIQGTGLGMSITKNFVDIMGGDIRVESQLGQGSTFTVELDFEVSELPLDKAFWESHGISRILTIDHNQHVLDEIQEALKDTQVKLTCTTDGQAAVECVRDAHSKNQDFQIILLDWKIQGLGCIETAREIQKIMGQDAPIYLLTGYNRKETEEAAREIGVTRFLFKPFFLSSLRQSMEAAAAKEEPAPDLQKAQPLQGKRFLAAEDNELNSEILLEVLSLQGAQCELADNGRRALEMFENSAPGYYDAILMDVQMPVMNGYETARAIRQCPHPNAESIPIIAMTANTFAEDVQNALNAGMNAHVAKPINMDEICRVIQEQTQ